MAEKDTTIELDDEETISVDVSDNPDLFDDVSPKPKETQVAAPQTKPVTKQTAVDDAAASLTKAAKELESEKLARQAAEQTANNERRQREDTLRLMREREAENQSLRERASTHELTSVTEGIDSAKRALEMAQREFERAMEAGEFSKSSAAQVQMSQAAAKIERLESEKVRIETRPAKTETTEGRVEATGTPFDKYLAGFSTRSQAWLRLHSDCVPPEAGGDQTKNAKMMAGHYSALSQGLQPESDEYFRVIEENLGLRSPVSTAAVTVEADPDPAPKPKPRPTAQPSAPVTRDPPAQPGARLTRSVTLSPAQKEVALMSFGVKLDGSARTPQEAYALYARNLLEAEAEGKIGRYAN